MKQYALAAWRQVGLCVSCICPVPCCSLYRIAGNALLDPGAPFCVLPFSSSGCVGGQGWLPNSGAKDALHRWSECVLQ